MATEMRHLPGHSDRETGFHHPVAYGEAAGMIETELYDRIHVNESKIVAGINSMMQKWSPLIPRRLKSNILYIYSTLIS